MDGNNLSFECFAFFIRVRLGFCHRHWLLFVYFQGMEDTNRRPATTTTASITSIQCILIITTLLCRPRPSKHPQPCRPAECRAFARFLSSSRAWKMIFTCSRVKAKSNVKSGLTILLSTMWKVIYRICRRKC